jgi:hypothetical protein
MPKKPKPPKPKEDTPMKPGWLYGWKDIACYVGCSESTIKIFYRRFSLPVDRSPNGTPMAKPEKIDTWLTKREFASK